MYMRTRLQAIKYSCLLFLFCFVLAACNEDASKPTTAGKDSTATGMKEDQKNLVSLASEVCDCVTNLENDLNEEAKNRVMSAEGREAIDTIWKTLPQQQQDIYAAEGKKALACLRDLEKRHPFFNSRNKSIREPLLKAVEEHCSPFAAALVRNRR